MINFYLSVFGLFLRLRKRQFIEFWFELQNIDLHALTGWIPERWAIRLNDPTFNKDKLFKTLLTRLHNGDVLVTVATGDLSDADADRTGLVSTHAYAVLDAREIKVSHFFSLKM